MKLHVGSGPLVREGWVNVDNQPYEGVDHVLDVTQGLPFENVDVIYAEHFIEHLSYAQGMAFLRECRRVLADSGVLRLSTPNLDWVWATQYHPGEWTTEAEAVRDCFWMNKAFRGWGHQFLYNGLTLRHTLLAAGFSEVESCAYGESRDPRLRSLEGHEQYPDHPGLPHVVVVEARGRAAGEADSSILGEHLSDYTNAISAI